MTTNQSRLTIKVNLDVPLGKLQVSIQRVIHLVALGLNATPRLTQEDLKLQGTSINVVFHGAALWPVEGASEGFKHWILVNGFRDATEAIGSFLEEVRSILAAWQLVIRNRTEAVNFTEWQEAEKRNRRRFDRFPLPHKIEHLEQQYGLPLDSDLTKHIISINVARNCLVHRRGIVQEEDINENGALQVSWRRLVLAIQGKGDEREAAPGAIVEPGEDIFAAVRDASKTFPAGALVSFSVQEFADVCWAIFLFGQSTITLIKEWGNAHGFEFQSPQDVGDHQGDTPSNHRDFTPS